MEYYDFELENGLKVVVQPDNSTKVAVVDVLYDVGSRDEAPGKTGFAHLFEHLMFGGSKNIPSYDGPLQQVGGENNAFTSPDVTNYYISIPSNNLETAFWLESDRMLSLSFDPNVLEVQRKVVIEEFKQRYLNQPYGDAWLKLRPLAYKDHSYKWATIGEKIEHIADATMEDVKAFFKKYYLPCNAILSVVGDVTPDQVRILAERWFGPIPGGEKPKRIIPIEPRQTAARTSEVEAEVPLNAIYKVYHMPGRNDPNYHASDLLSDILGRGKSSRLYRRLVKETRYLNSLSTYVTGSIDPGLLVINGKLNDDVTYEQVENEISNVIQNLLVNGISEDELTKVKNQAQSSFLFSEVELLNRAFNLAYYTLMGDTDLLNQEVNKIKAVREGQIIANATDILRNSNCSTLYYNKTQASPDCSG